MKENNSRKKIYYGLLINVIYINSIQKILINFDRQSSIILLYFDIFFVET
jgi:hypothetical protein